MTNVATLSDADTSVEDIVRKIAADAKAASHALGLVDGETRNAALQAGANAIRDSLSLTAYTNPARLYDRMAHAIGAAPADRYTFGDHRDRHTQRLPLGSGIRAGLQTLFRYTTRQLPA